MAGQGFLSAATEKKRIATFQANNLRSSAGPRDQDFIDMFLRLSLPGRRLADVDQDGIWPRLVEKLWRCEAVENDDVRRLQ